MFTPTFKGPIEGYVVNFMQTNYWRVQATMTRVDVMQEAYYVFLRCSRKYSATVEGPQHFMALFKTAWRNHFTDLAHSDSQHRCDGTQDGSVTTTEVVGETENEGYLRTLVRQAPREVALVLTMLFNVPQEILEMCLSPRSRSGRNGGDAADNARVAQLLGMPPDSKPLDAVRDYFAATK